MGDGFEVETHWPFWYREGRQIPLPAMVLGICTSFAVPFLVLLLFPYAIPSKTTFAVVVACLSLLLFMKLILGVSGGFRFNNRFSEELLLGILYIVSLIGVAVLTTTSTDVTVFVQDYSPDKIMAWVLVVMLTGFLPGYSLQQISGVSKDLRSEEMIVYAILTSILITGLVGYVSMGVSFVVLRPSTALVAVNMVILAAYSIHIVSGRYHHDPDTREARTLSIDIVTAAIVALTAFFVYASYFVVHSFLVSPLPLLGDEFGHVGQIMRFLRGLEPWQEASLGLYTAPAYPYLFHLFMGVGITTSGLSVVEFYTLSSLLLLPLPALSFFTLSRSVIEGKTIPLLSLVVFQVFSGLGWIGAFLSYGSGNEITQIYTSSSLTCDIIYSLWLPIIVAPYLIDFSVFFVVLWLILNKRMSSRRLTFMLFPLLLLSTMVHFEKSIVLGVIGLTLAVLQLPFREKPFRTMELGSAVVTSTLLVIMLDYLGSKSLYASSLLNGIVYLVTAGSAIVIISMMRLDSYYAISKLRQFAAGRFRPIVISCLVALAIVACLETYFSVMPSPQFGTIPLRFLPLKLGLSSILSTIWVLMVPKESIRHQMALLLLISSALIGQLLLYHSPLAAYTIGGRTLAEFRFIRDVTWPPFAIAAASGLSIVTSRISAAIPPIGGLSQSVHLARRFGSRRPIVHVILGSLLVASVVAPSVLSNMLKIEFQTASSGVPADDIGVVQFMGNRSIPAGSSIFASDDSVGRYVYASTGALVYTPRTPYSGDVLWSSEDPAAVLWMLKYLNISYVVVQSAAGSPVLTRIMDYFPRAYDDGRYRVYEIGQFSQPSLLAETALLSVRPVDTYMDYGLDPHPQWSGNLSRVDDWVFDNLSSSNVLAYDISATTNGTLRLAAESNENTHMVMFVRHLLTNPIAAKEGSLLWVKFRTEAATKLLVRLWYDDGETTSGLYNGVPFMTSDDWAWSTTPVTAHEGFVVSFQIGITNHFQENCSYLRAEVGFMGISDSGESEKYLEAVAALTLARVHYMIDYENEPELKTAWTNIVVPDGVHTNDTMMDLVQLAQGGRRAVVVGDILESDWAFHFLDIAATNLSVIIDHIDVGGMVFPVPAMNVTVFDQTGGTVLAWYSGAQDIPLLTSVPVDEVAVVYYMNLHPLMEMVRLLDPKVELEWFYRTLEALFLSALGLPASANQEERSFYVKNTGSIDVEGNVTIVCSGLAVPEDVIIEDNSSNGLYLVHIDGSATLESIRFGITGVTLRGSLRVVSDGRIVFESTGRELRLFVTSMEIAGSGKLVFAALSSGFPYPTVPSGVRYQATGNFSIDTLSLYSGCFFLLPKQLLGFSG